MQVESQATIENSSAAVIAIDIGGTNLRMALVSCEGHLLQRLATECQIEQGINPFLEKMGNAIESLKLFAATAGIMIRAVGAGVPGVTDRSGRIVSSVNLAPLAGFNLLQWLAATSGLPAVILNDANAAAFAELTYGAGRAFDSFIHFTLGTGVGSGLVLDKRVWSGRRGVAAEYGHATVEPDGRLCNCGNHGCLEQYASATGIAASAREFLAANRNSALASVAAEELTAALIATAAARGDRVAIDCFESAGRYLGIAAASAVNLLDLEAIIIGGGVAESFALLEPAVTAELMCRTFPPARIGLQVLQGELGDNAGLLGGAAAAWHLVD